MSSTISIIGKLPLALTKNGISYINKEEAFDVFHNSFYGITHSATPQGMSIEQYAESSCSLLLLSVNQAQEKNLLHG